MPAFAAIGFVICVIIGIKLTIGGFAIALYTWEIDNKGVPSQTTLFFLFLAAVGIVLLYGCWYYSPFHITFALKS